MCVYKYIYILFFYIFYPKLKNKKLGSSIFQESNKNNFSFAEYFLFTLNEGFYCIIMNGGVQNVGINFLIFNFIIPQINYLVLIG